MFVSAAAAGQVLSFAFHVFAHDNRMKIKDCDLLLSAVFGKPSGGQEQAAFTRCKNAIYEVKQNKTQNENRKKKERKKCGRWFGELLGRNLVRAPRASRTRRAGGRGGGFLAARRAAERWSLRRRDRARRTIPTYTHTRPRASSRRVDATATHSEDPNQPYPPFIRATTHARTPPCRRMREAAGGI